MMSDAIHFSSKFHYTSYFPPQRLYLRSMSSFKRSRSTVKMQENVSNKVRHGPGTSKNFQNGRAGENQIVLA